MARILFLAHRIPYPPNKGDKIRSWHFLKHLCKQHEVHLGCFIDDPADLAHVEFLETICSSVTCSFATPLKQKLASLKGLLTGTSLTENAYPSRKLRHDIAARLTSQPFDLVFIFSAASFTFLPKDLPDTALVTDFVDVDSAKWGAYADQARWPMSMIYAREAQKLADFEAKVADVSRVSFLVSEDEAGVLKSMLTAHGVHADVRGIPNGVDAEAFSPKRFEHPPVADRIIFTGAMDYLPNVEAVTWFVEQVFDQVKQALPATEFVIAGRPVSPSVQRLDKRAGVTVLGGVEDMAAEIAKAALVVAPLQTARGIQNKVLEGMAMSKPVLCTPAANEGINAPDGEAVVIAQHASDFASKVIALLSSEKEREAIGQRARAYVLDNFSWQTAERQLDTSLEGVLPSGQTGGTA